MCACWCRVKHVAWFSTAPPVEANFTTNCLRQSDRFPHITCEEDGSFTPVQCTGGRRGMCFCVNTTTGHRLNGMPHTVPVEERDTINCTRGELCHHSYSCTPELPVQSPLPRSTYTVSTITAIAYINYIAIAWVRKFLGMFQFLQHMHQINWVHAFLMAYRCTWIGWKIYVLIWSGTSLYYHTYNMLNAHTLKRFCNPIPNDLQFSTTVSAYRLVAHWRTIQASELWSWKLMLITFKQYSSLVCICKNCTI